MESVSAGVLLVLALVAFANYRNRTLGPWLRAKFFNEPPGGEPRPAAAAAAAPAVTSASYTGLGGALGVLQAPVDGPRTSGFGPRGGEFHAGIDLGVPVGTPVRAARAGKVIYAGPSSGYGLRVDLDHGGGVVTRYAHLSRIDVPLGRDVAAGSTFALSGNTGHSTGPHLHFELRLGGRAVDPSPYLASAGAGAAPSWPTAAAGQRLESA